MGLNPLVFFVAYLFPCLVVLGHQLGGYFHFLTVGFTFVVVPLLDLCCGRNKFNLEEPGYKQLKNQRIYQWITWLFVPTHLALIIWSLWVIKHGQLQLVEQLGFCLSIGIVSGGVGITLAHEMGHRNDRIDQTLAQTLLMTVSYPHFFIEHNLGHHARVATHDDPASARFNEPFYQFFFRSAFLGYQHSWHLEARRLRKQKRSVFSLNNRMVVYSVFMVFSFTAMALFSLKACLFFAVQSLVAILLLELVNYVEHYGLERQCNEHGRYEKVKPIHSWNASEVVTNCILFHLQRHSDHHANPTRPYQTLRHFDEAPQLPTGYAGMVLLALCPPLWRKVMNPKVVSLTKVQATL